MGGLEQKLHSQLNFLFYFVLCTPCIHLPNLWVHIKQIYRKFQAFMSPNSTQWFVEILNIKTNFWKPLMCKFKRHRFEYLYIVKHNIHSIDPIFALSQSNVMDGYRVVWLLYTCLIFAIYHYKMYVLKTFREKAS